MLQRFAIEFGPWTWWIVGFILFAAELAAPGVFLVWIGAAALVVGSLSLMLWESAWWSWQIQALLFAVLSVVFALLGRRYFRERDSDTDEPFLNRREAGLIGRTATLTEPLREGRGRIRLDDTWWPVEGPDLPAGTRVVVSAAHGSKLTVAASEQPER